MRGRDGFSLREVACVGAQRTLWLAEIAQPEAPTVAIAAGIHGDEPAAPWALYSIVRDGLLDRSFGYRIWVCTNPSGYELGTRQNAEGVDINRSFGGAGKSPEARAIVTANRDRKFAITMDLHEDYEAEGFYCYESVLDGTPYLGPEVVQAVDDAELPVQELHDEFELGYPPDAHHLRVIERGRVMPDARAEMAFSGNQPYSMYLLRARAAPRSLTVESPSSLPWDVRIAMHRVVVTTALAGLRSIQS
ncbi:MAG: succinylglutamate desuccinylase/aspartoacylase family protein [Vulcanimicrobiaceae bacterium]